MYSCLLTGQTPPLELPEARQNDRPIDEVKGLPSPRLDERPFEGKRRRNYVYRSSKGHKLKTSIDLQLINDDAVHRSDPENGGESYGWIADPTTSASAGVGTHSPSLAHDGDEMDG